MAKKVASVREEREVVYDSARWNILRKLRDIAIVYLRELGMEGFEAIVHGSLARGDVTPKSDVDIFIPDVRPSYLVESIVCRVKQISKRELTQATPAHTLKAILYVEENVKITFPLLPIRQKERDFYRFGGELGLEGLEAGRRVAGIDKRLMVIIPTEYGHSEFSALDNAVRASKVLGVKLETVQERVRVLTRRDRIGRTGIFYKSELGEDETFEGRLRERASEDPSLRRLIQQRGLEFKY